MIMALGFHALNCQESEEVKCHINSALVENNVRNQGIGRIEDLVFRLIQSA
jgi:hypothetical protein